MKHTRLFLALLTAFSFVFAPAADAQPRKKRPKPATMADIERLEAKIAEQQKVIERLVKLQKQYAQTVAATLDGTPTPVAATTPAPAPVTAPATMPGTTKSSIEATPAVVVKPPVERAPRPKVVKQPPPEKDADAGVGTVVGKVAGASDAIVYVETINAPGRGTATMKQEGKQFIPQVLVVPKGTTVDFPNRDAIFHNVFSVTPDHSFDLGSYRQGESKRVTMSKTGVVTVYCNMHPQMVGHILVTPNANYVRAGKDGFFRLPNVPAGTHRIVAWAPNAKPVTVTAKVTDGEVVTVELKVEKRRRAIHTKKDGLPYGSYEK